MVSTGYIGWYFIKEMRPDMMNYTVTTILLSVDIVLDITWLILYWSNFWSEPYIDDNSQLTLRQWSLVCSVILVGLEVVAAFYTYSLSANERLIKSTK